MNCQLKKEKFSNTLILSDFFKYCKREYYSPRIGVGTNLMQDQKPITAFCEKDEEELVFHLVVTKSFKMMHDHFLWPHKKKGDVKRRCQSYVICKLSNTQPHGLHHSVPIPLLSLNEISIAFVELPRIRMHKDFLVLIMNMFSKLFHFVSFHKTSVKLHHAHLIFEGITRLHSFLKIKLDLLDAFHELEHSLSDPVFSDEVVSCLSAFHFNEAFMLFRTESKFVWYKVLSKMKLMCKFALCAFKWVQNETCLLLYRDPMTVIMHLFFAKGVDYNVGTKEEPPDSKAISSNFFARTGIGVVVTMELNIYQLYVLVEMIMMLEFLAGAFNESVHEVEPHLERRNNNAQSFVLRGKPSLISFIDDSNLLFLVIGKTDLRTNLFEEGGDDIRMDQQLELEPEEYLEQLEQELGAKELGAKELEPELGGDKEELSCISKAMRTPLIEFKGSLEAHGYQTTLVSIQAA